MKQVLFLFAICLIYCAAFSQSINLSTENYLLLNGERFKNQKINFTKADGDWFATSKDAHGTITFYGNYDGRELRLDIEWDGRNEPHVITNEMRHDEKRIGEFLLTMPDKAVYGDGLDAYPDGDDEVKITIQKIDEAMLSGEIKGTIDQGKNKIIVNGIFNLKKTVTGKKIVNSSYKDCDNVVHDKLIGAEGRSPSECEAKYDLDVRTAIHDALEKVIEKFQADGWEIEDQTKLDDLFVVGRGSEKDIFNTNYELKMRLGQATPIYAEYYKKFNDLSEKLKEPSKENLEQFMKFGREMNSSINNFIRFSVNNHGFGFVNFKGGCKITKLSNSIFILQSDWVQSRTGGDEDQSVNASFLLIGNWKQPVVEKLDDGVEQVKASAVLNPAASHLQAQNIIIRIECSNAIANEVIKHLDIQKLQSLINRN